MHRKGDGCFLNLNITTKKEEKKGLSWRLRSCKHAMMPRERAVLTLMEDTRKQSGWWVTGSKCTGAKEKVEANRNPGQHRHNNKHIRTHKCTSQLLIGNKERVSVLNWRWQAWSRRRGTYPEYNVESENEILDAAAHFVSLEMLSWHHLDGFCFPSPPLQRAGITFAAVFGSRDPLETPFNNFFLRAQHMPPFLASNY